MTYREEVLSRNRNAMVAYLVTENHLAPEMAAAMCDQLWDRVTAFLATEKGLAPERAGAVLNEALGFLALIAADPAHGPAGEVDAGWHALMIYSLEYTALCHALCGRYIHHLPTDVAGFNTEDVAPGEARAYCSCIDGGQGGHLTTLAETVTAMAARGPVDLALWAH